MTTIETSFAEALARAGAQADTTLDIAGMALLLGALDLEPERYRAACAHLAALDERARALADRALTLADKAALLAQVLHTEAGYTGDRESYDHPDNANLVRVTERRRGLPVALGILYIHLGEVLSWTVEGLAMPGHFLVHVADGEGRVVLDPFDGGRIVERPTLEALVRRVEGEGARLEPTHIAPVSKRAVLLRLENNLKSRAISEQRLERAAEILARMTAIAPADAGLWFERGMMASELGQLGAAREALAHCLAATDDRALIQRAGQALAALRRKLN